MILTDMQMPVMDRDEAAASDRRSAERGNEMGRRFETSRKIFALARTIAT